ncbi:peptidase M20/M25/M40 family protein [Actinidia rufa]|uniref:Peptidase M20/M25/M40 family protein n=1 Tax=Actinidia rufa TaxID=165716 RepID=A0A7J0FH66_9ERIC|nr:peptidase M20/M25/M40 family protein [Actinidia rufa]
MGFGDLSSGPGTARVGQRAPLLRVGQRGPEADPPVPGARLRGAPHESAHPSRARLALGVEYSWPVAKTGVVGSIGSGGRPFFALPPRRHGRSLPPGINSHSLCIYVNMYRCFPLAGCGLPRFFERVYRHMLEKGINYALSP